MNFDFRIALYTTMLDTRQSRLGHLWHRARNSQPPDWYGQPWPELDPVFRQQRVVHSIGTHQFSIAGNSRRRKSTALLGSILRNFGVLDFQVQKLQEHSFSARLSLDDYERQQVSLTALSRLIGCPVPPSFSGGHWFACHAQHQATSGTLELAYDRTDGFDLAAQLEDRSNPENQGSGTGDREPTYGDATLDVAQPDSASPIPHPPPPAGRLQLVDQSAGVQLFSFSAVRPLVFGVSLQHLWEQDGRFSSFGNRHSDVDYAGS